MPQPSQKTMLINNSISFSHGPTVSPTSTAIKGDPVRFTTESKAIFNALSKRIHRENTELYVLLDALA